MKYDTSAESIPETYSRERHKRFLSAALLSVTIFLGLYLISNPFAFLSEVNNHGVNLVPNRTHNSFHGYAPSPPVWNRCYWDNQYDCTTIHVPMDHDNLDDDRSFGIGVIRLNGTSNQPRKSVCRFLSSYHISFICSRQIILNPGGPGDDYKLTPL
jgi:hypothetical protein